MWTRAVCSCTCLRIRNLVKLCCFAGILWQFCLLPFARARFSHQNGVRSLLRLHVIYYHCRGLVCDIISHHVVIIFFICEFCLVCRLSFSFNHVVIYNFLMSFCIRVSYMSCVSIVNFVRGSRRRDRLVVDPQWQSAPKFSSLPLCSCGSK